MTPARARTLDDLRDPENPESLQEIEAELTQDPPAANWQEQWDNPMMDKARPASRGPVRQDIEHDEHQYREWQDAQHDREAA